MKRGYKFRIYPTDEQKRYFAVCIAANRWFWNYCLEKTNKTYEETKDSDKKIHLSACYQIARELPSLKNNPDTSWIKKADASSLIFTAKSLDTAFSSFFNGIGGKPKFKEAKNCNSYKVQVQKDIDWLFDWKKGTVKLGKAGPVKIKLHRKIYGRITEFTVSKKADDYYEISFLVDDNINKKELKEHTIEGTVGIDMGQKTDGNAILSDGKKFPTVDVSKIEKRIKKINKKLSKKGWIETDEKIYSKKYKKEVNKKIPSKNRIKCKNKLAKLYAKIERIRAYNTHMISSYVAKNENIDTVCVEDLQVKGMMKNHKLARGTANANMGELGRQLEYKCDWNGKNFVKVGTYYASTQLCSVCGYKNTDLKGFKSLNKRSWICPQCGTKHDRDINAAINIKNEGHRLLSEGKQ